MAAFRAVRIGPDEACTRITLLDKYCVNKSAEIGATTINYDYNLYTRARAPPLNYIRGRTSERCTQPKRITFLCSIISTLVNGVIF